MTALAYKINDDRPFPSSAKQGRRVLDTKSSMSGSRTLFPSDIGRLIKDLLLKKDRTHSERVCLISLLLVKRLRDPALSSFDVIAGALFHDIGKLKIPLQILSKRKSLTPAEHQIMAMHCQFGQAMLSDIPLLKKAGQIVLAHHERYDGTGYPRGLKQQEIPLGAGIVAIADSFDAMTCNRPYKKRTDITTAREEILAHSGSQFDPRLVDLFNEIPLSILATIAEDEKVH